MSFIYSMDTTEENTSYEETVSPNNIINGSALTSPTVGTSPVSELSSDLQCLQCHDAVTPNSDTLCRKLQLTPELMTPRPVSLGDNVCSPSGTPTETPTGVRNESHFGRRGMRFSPDCSAPKIRRLRVKLSTKFSAMDAGQRDLASKCFAPSPPLGGVNTSFDEDGGLASIQAILLMHRVNTRRKPVPLSILNSSEDQNLSLIGDWSKPLVLPVERVDHQNISCISAQTVASLLKGEYQHSVERILIIDCRYPYEHQGGHIKGSLNLYTEAQVKQAFLQVCSRSPPPPRGRSPTGTSGEADPGGPSPLSAPWKADGVREHPGSPERRTAFRKHGSPAAAEEAEGGAASPRKLIVFHCEFSTERAPRLCQYLRKLDRTLHFSCYPLLFYPELYMLDGGYKQFFSSFPELCDPQGYTPMRPKDYQKDLYRTRRRTKSRLGKRPYR